MSTWRRRLLTLQAGYYGITGVWPIVHLRSFEAVTGPKTDDWLVHMVGLLAAAIGLVLGVSVRRGSVQTPEITLLAISSALAFAAIDLWYGLTGRISPIYLGDAVVQICLILGLLFLRGGFVGAPPASDRR
jgi:ABC-type branched-subunit amino acid transport system permease subunit